MRFAGIVQDQTSQFHPGVRLEAPRLFSSTDAQLDRNPAPDKKPPQHQRPLETADVKNEMPTNRVLDARDLAPHLIPFYLKELAAQFHSYYNAEQFLVPDPRLRRARLALVAAVGQVVRNGLGVLGVSAPEKM